MSKYITQFELSDLVKESNCKISNSGEYILICPICKLNKGEDYSKSKLYINKDMSVGHCFVCESVFLNKSGKKDLVLDLNHKKTVKLPSLFPDIHFYGDDPLDINALTYLKNRCPQLYTDFDFHKYGFYATDNRIVIKFLKGIQDYFYQIRFIESDDGHRYFTPPVKEELGKPFYITLGEYSPFNPTVLVEGVFTGLTEKLLFGKNVNVLAILGHSMTDYQIALLQNLGQMGQIFVHMDTYQYSCNIRKKICKKYPNIKIIPNYSEELDSEEIIRTNRLTPEQYQNYLFKYIKSNNKLVIK